MTIAEIEAAIRTHQWAGPVHAIAWDIEEHMGKPVVIIDTRAILKRPGLFIPVSVKEGDPQELVHSRIKNAALVTHAMVEDAKRPQTGKRPSE